MSLFSKAFLKMKETTLKKLYLILEEQLSIRKFYLKVSLKNMRSLFGKLRLFISNKKSLVKLFKKLRRIFYVDLLMSL